MLLGKKKTAGQKVNINYHLFLDRPRVHARQMLFQQLNLTRSMESKRQNSESH